MTPARLALLAELLEEYRAEFLAERWTLDLPAFAVVQLALVTTERGIRDELASSQQVGS